MAKVFIEEITLTAIGDAIREKEGTSELVPVVDMADRIKDIPSSGGGYDEGFEAGKKAEYDAFWNSSADNHNWAGRFAGSCWNATTFKPNYNLILTGTCAYCFYHNAAEIDLVDYLEKKGLTMDTSAMNNSNNLFTYSCFTRLGEIDMSGATTANSTFAYMHSLHTIEKLIVSEALGFSSTFYDCPALVKLIVEGVIGQNGLNLRYSPKLSKESITSIINTLSTATNGLTVTLSTAAVNKAFETSEGANDGKESAEWKTLKETKSNWNIGYA